MNKYRNQLILGVVFCGAMLLAGCGGAAPEVQTPPTSQAEPEVLESPTKQAEPEIRIT